MRASERIAAGYFLYVAILAASFHLHATAIFTAFTFTAIVWALIVFFSRFANGRSYTRDLIPLGYTFLAYREMDLFTPSHHVHELEQSWIHWDRQLLDGAQLRGGIESFGVLLPGFFELCYALVYAVALVAIAAIFLNLRRDRIDLFWIAYLTGTLGAYALFPFFPSEPPRVVFPDSDLPRITTLIRDFNLFIVGGYGIHSSVFPSAHVSSAMSAAWGLLTAIPNRRWIGWSMAIYGVMVAIATIYGRYHYAVDVLAGTGVSLVALIVVRLAVRHNQPRQD
jgi:membrane-associated phospholipid phosphatase